MQGRIREEVFKAFTTLKYQGLKPAQPEAKIIKRVTRGKDLYFQQALSNFVECLSENMKQTKFKVFQHLKSSAIMMTHQQQTFIKIVHKL